MQNFNYSKKLLKLNPCSDPVFKSIFTRDVPESKKALRGLVSAVVKKKLKVVNVTANEPSAHNLDDKQIRYDISCVLDGGEKANIEMTLWPTAYEAYKMEYYLNRLHTSQDVKGKNGYQNIKQSYQISIFAKANMFRDAHFFHRFIYNDPEHGIDLGGRTAIYTVELQKLGEIKQKSVEEMTALEKWACFFAYYADPDKQEMLRMITEREEEISMAQKMMYKITPEEEAALYQMSVDKARMDRVTREYEFKQKLKLGRQRARREGLKEGRQEGLEQGIVQGRAELAGDIVDLLRKGMSLEQVESYLRENGLQD